MKNNKKDMKLNNIDSVKMELKALKHPSTRKEFERREFLLDEVRKYNNDMLDAALELEEFDMRNYNSPQLYNKGMNLSWENKKSQDISHCSDLKKTTEREVSCLILCDLQKGIDEEEKLNDYINNLSRNLNLDDFDIIVSTKLKNTINFPFKNLNGDVSTTNEGIIEQISFSEYNSDVSFERETKSIFTSELNKYIKDNNINNIYLCGYDLCTTIIASVFDALKFEYNLKVLTYLCSTSYPEYCKRASLEILNINTPKYLLNSELES